MNNLVQTFVTLAGFDEMYPHEQHIMTYIADRLSAAGLQAERDTVGNLIARIPGSSVRTIGLCSHVDIAAPLGGRQIIIKGDTIGTDGKGLLGGDDKTAVAAMLELADEIKAQGIKPEKTIELLFTVGEENDLNGSRGLQPGTLITKDVLVFDWLGGVQNIIACSPARYSLDVTFTGKDAHPAQWKTGRNAGAALIEAASGLLQGEYAPGVIFTIGIVEIGNARNKIPGSAHLKAEMRSYDPAALELASRNISRHLEEVANTLEIVAKIEFSRDPNAYQLDADSQLYREVVAVLDDMKLTPNPQPTYGRFDGNSFAANGMNVIIMGAAYANPHSPEETVSIKEFQQMYDFVRRMCLARGGTRNLSG